MSSPVVRRMQAVTAFSVTRSSAAEDLFADVWDAVVDLTKRAGEAGCLVPQDDEVSRFPELLHIGNCRHQGRRLALLRETAPACILALCFCCNMIYARQAALPSWLLREVFTR